jgi:hypothetical protein
MKRHITIEELFDGTEDIAKLIEEIEFKKKWDREHTYVIDIIKLLHGRSLGFARLTLTTSCLKKGRRTASRFRRNLQRQLRAY